LPLPGVDWLRSAIRKGLGLGRRREVVGRPDRLIVGLGNPGPDYAHNRHNVGFRIVEAFAARHEIALDRQGDGGLQGVGPVAGQTICLLLPLTFMNKSGDCVEAVLGGLPDLDVVQHGIVVFDDLDLPSGHIRMRAAGGAGGHRGMSSILAALGHANLPRLRFGIGRPPQGVRVVDYVLADFDESEREPLPGRIDAAVDALDCFVGHGIGVAMDRANAVSSQGDRA
jgi:PTH1 family peptidyl-tRNA hydrolase